MTIRWLSLEQGILKILAVGVLLGGDVSKTVLYRTTTPAFRAARGCCQLARQSPDRAYRAPGTGTQLMWTGRGFQRGSQVEL